MVVFLTCYQLPFSDPDDQAMPAQFIRRVREAAMLARPGQLEIGNVLTVMAPN